MGKAVKDANHSLTDCKLSFARFIQFFYFYFQVSFHLLPRLYHRSINFLEMVPTPESDYPIVAFDLRVGEINAERVFKPSNLGPRLAIVGT